MACLSRQPAPGRLLRGVQGTLSAWELHTIRARMPAGLLHKAARGALALPLPTGFERGAQGRVHKDPPLAGPARLTLGCEPFLQRRSASQGLAFFHTHG
jgi:hypothetical protein